ncbi:MAG: UDP-3-O-(3-hydroxymyristoyl)glucosamine N-acyltransferase [Candidatus Omnitrophica bacterium]|nr:UDP-3-O-(3-hydroxymyristoyl)glucosamine N-acyltransferase [Candidatus Omnitrophota bacterium]MCF7893469.1 UDP-3-O-(3-hydroxymyristoyl)glucosamine N-acyltransferase [Candidatus Omnitrophota bacterium]
MNYKLSQISEIVGGELSGNPDIIITGISGIKQAKEGDITFLANPKYSSLLNSTGASAVITSRDISSSRPVIKTDNPSVAFAKVVDLVVGQSCSHPQGISAKSIVDKGAKIADSVSIGPFTFIAEGAEVGEGSIIYGGCFIGHKVKVGKNCLVYPNTTIREKTEIGNKVIIHSGTVIGSDGFGFELSDGSRKKIPQIGIVKIEDNVEIGANVTIDRARFDKTTIGKGTKIDNLVQIAHNVTIGKNCIIIAQVGISGSTVVEEGAILAGQAGIVGHIKIGRQAVVGAQAGVTKSVPAETKVSGYPAKPHRQAAKINACIQKLPELNKKVKQLEDKIKSLEESQKK